MNKNLSTLVGALMALALLAAACGGSDSASVTSAEPQATAPSVPEDQAEADEPDEPAEATAPSVPEDQAEADEPDEPAEATANVGDADQDVIDAVVEQMTGEELPEGLDANCMATAMVGSLGGAEAMEREFGLTAETIRAGQQPDDVELESDQAISLADGLMDCGFADIVVSELAGDGLSNDDAACLFENIDQNLVRDVIAAGFMNAEDAAAIEANADNQIIPSLMGAFVNCDIDPTVLGG